MRRVVIPYYGADPIRDENREAVVRHLWDGGFDEQLLQAGGSSMAEARNNGLRVALEQRADVVVFNDADSLVDPERIEAACELALDGRGVVFAYDLYIRLSQDGRALYLSGEHECHRLPFEGQQLFGAPSIGCVAVRAGNCLEFDGGFLGWGYEDMEWLDRMAAWLGPHRRLSGPLYHLWHGPRRLDDSPADSDPAAVRLNLERWLGAREARRG